MKNVIILYGGDSVESEISLQSAQGIIKNIDQTKFWINKLTLDMEQEGMQKILQHKQDKYNRIKK